MRVECVVLDGEIINIGPWESTEPIPEGATIEEREVIDTADGGRVVAEDYATLRKVAFPDYSAFDILDELLKHVTPAPGSKLEQIINERNTVKVMYPKPE